MCSSPLCPAKTKIVSDNEGDNLNKLAVLGAMSTGSGFAQEEEKFGIMGVKYMNRYKFSLYEVNTGEIIKLCAQDTMENTILDEKKAAECRGDKDANGYYSITAVVDGGCLNAATGVVTMHPAELL